MNTQQMETFPPTGQPAGVKQTLQLEGVAIAATALALYAYSGFQWWVLALFFLAPDLAMLGYLAGPRVGATVYNAAHTTVVPLALAGMAFVFGWMLGVQIALIWLLHIGVDRAVGYGLKHPEHFKRTHLSA
jgi:hypothetical protein